MKKILLSILITGAVNFCYAQSVNFKIAYMPDHNYQLSGNMTMNISTDLSKVPQIADQLTKQGISEPVNAVMNMQLSGLVTTGDPGADKTFPYVMNYGMSSMSFNINGKQIPIPVPANSNTKIYGRVNPEGQLSVDSLNGKKIADSIQQKTVSMMNNILQMVKFPDHPLNVGDSFTQQVPLNIPMLSGVSNNVATTYTLVSIKGNIANFDVKQDMNMHMNIKGKVDIGFTGAGGGKMVYDISNGFPVSYTTNANMQITVKTDKINVSGNLIMTGTMNYTITGK